MATHQVTASNISTTEKGAHETHHSNGTEANKAISDIDYVAEQKLVRKLDLWIVPPGEDNTRRHA